MLKAYTPRIFVTGFSTGGALALKLASEHHPEIIGIIAVAIPIKFVDYAFMLVSLLHGTNTLVDWVSAYEGVKPFIENIQEHPDINYRHIPIKSLYELRRLIHELHDCLPLCTSPVLVMHGDNDPVVAVKSAYKVMDAITHANKQLKIIHSTRHGILMENTDRTWNDIDDFMRSCAARLESKNL
jgi:esterase/lipase